MQEIHLSGLFVQPLARQIAEWLEEGKLDEGDLDRGLTPNARALVESATLSADWVPLADVESLVGLAAGQLGGETGLVEWTRTTIAAWAEQDRLGSVLAGTRGMVDAMGYGVTQAMQQLVRNPDWYYEGGSEAFSVRLTGLVQASSDLMALLGALLSGLVEGCAEGFEDIRFEGVDAEALMIFGERSAPHAIDESSESRLHRAALIG
jgi:hypothetical protein